MVGWAVLPYPLPKGRFGPTVRDLVLRVDAAWPAGPVPHLLADRACPSGDLFRLLGALGWDGKQGWDLGPTAARLRAVAEVEALVGLWALGALLQRWVGARAGAARLGWTTTGRLSIWARGKFALGDPHGRLRRWLAEALADGAARIAAPTVPAPLPLAALAPPFPRAA